MLSLHGLSGEEYGTVSYVVPTGTTTVSVPLTSAGITALDAGNVVQVDVVPGFQWPVFGYRMFLQSA
jgi:hypothetical protein